MTSIQPFNPNIEALQAALGIIPQDGKRGPQTTGIILSAADAGRLTIAPKVPAPVTGSIDQPAVDAVRDLPWMIEAKRMLGRHEGRDNGLLLKWLRSDKRTLGDPAKLPWCGDFVETCLRLGLPSERFPGALGENPYWARNWLLLGESIPATYGAVVVFARGTGGHVGFAVGQDVTALHVLGGNQSNAVTVARISKDRLLGARWPKAFARPVSIRLPTMTADGRISTNEA
jgi:uncharacterized protein (TIGR02594 family)